ncbi:MAG: CotS family spore coat protein [Clostridia bacterium]|nr:CotS family spore coat protein [Clostridia bacterium]
MKKQTRGLFRKVQNQAGRDKAMVENREMIETAYGMRISSIKPCRAGYILDTDQGKKYFRQCQCSENRIAYVHDAKQHLMNHGFTTLDPYQVTAEGRPSMEIESQLYIMTPFIDGRECEFGEDSDAIKASVALASMHKAGKGFKARPGLAIPNDLGKMPESLGKRYDEILRMRRKAERERGAFDYIYLDCVDKFTALAEESLRLLDGPEYPRLVKKTLLEGGICHHDYSYQNILMKGPTTYITGFEACGEEIRVYDLVNLLRRKMRKCNWNPTKATLLLEAYSEFEPITKDENVVMKAMLLFPQKFWRVANRYYNSRRSWAQKNFTGMLEEVVAEYHDHIRFMKQFDTMF